MPLFYSDASLKALAINYRLECFVFCEKAVHFWVLVSVHRLQVKESLNFWTIQVDWVRFCRTFISKQMGSWDLLSHWNKRRINHIWLNKSIVDFVWNIVDLLMWHILMYKEAFPCFPLAIYKLKHLVDFLT